MDSHTAELRGTVWGWVNRAPKGCEDDHTHAIWQKGAELRRACVQEHLPHTFKNRINNERSALFSVTRPLVGVWAKLSALRGEGFPRVSREDTDFVWTHEGLSMKVDLRNRTDTFSSAGLTLMGSHLQGYAENNALSDYLLLRQARAQRSFDSPADGELEAQEQEASDRLRLEIHSDMRWIKGQYERIREARHLPEGFLAVGSFEDEGIFERYAKLSSARDVDALVKDDAIVALRAEEMLEKYEACLAQERTYVEQYKANYEKILDAGQLFIAV